MGFFSSIGKLVGAAAPVVGAALGSPALGAAIGGGLSFLGGERANSAAAAAVGASNAQTERMMKRRHQWEVADLKAAGLNPVLSAGSAPSMGSSPVAPVENTLSGAAASARDIAMQQATIQNVKSQNKLIAEQVKKTAADTSASAQDARRLKAIADKEEFTKAPYAAGAALLNYGKKAIKFNHQALKELVLPHMPKVSSSAKDAMSDKYYRINEKLLQDGKSKAMPEPISIKFLGDLN